MAAEVATNSGNSLRFLQDAFIAMTLITWGACAGVSRRGAYQASTSFHRTRPLATAPR